MQKNNSKFKNDIGQRAYLFAIRIIKFIRTLDLKDPAIRILADQLLRCATSIGANIVEAQAASSRKDFTNFYNHALKSANECKFWIGLFRDAIMVSRNECEALLDEATQLANILASSILRLKGK